MKKTESLYSGASRNPILSRLIDAYHPRVNRLGSSSILLTEEFLVGIGYSKKLRVTGLKHAILSAIIPRSDCGSCPYRPNTARNSEWELRIRRSRECGRP